MSLVFNQARKIAFSYMVRSRIHVRRWCQYAIPLQFQW